MGSSGRDALRFSQLIAVLDVCLKVVLLFSVCVTRSHTAHTCAVTCLLEHTQESYLKEVVYKKVAEAYLTVVSGSFL